MWPEIAFWAALIGLVLNAGLAIFELDAGLKVAAAIHCVAASVCMLGLLGLELVGAA